MDPNKGRVLIIRVWIESGSAEPLRAQLLTETDVTAGIDRSPTFTRAEAVGDAVQEWLAEVVFDG